MSKHLADLTEEQHEELIEITKCSKKLAAEKKDLEDQIASKIKELEEQIAEQTKDLKKQLADKLIELNNCENKHNEILGITIVEAKTSSKTSSNNKGLLKSITKESVIKFFAGQSKSEVDLVDIVNSFCNDDSADDKSKQSARNKISKLLKKNSDIFRNVSRGKYAYYAEISISL